MEPDVAFDPYLMGADAQAVRKLAPPVQVTNRYAPVSKRFCAASPEFTERLWLTPVQAGTRRAVGGARLPLGPIYSNSLNLSCTEIPPYKRSLYDGTKPTLTPTRLYSIVATGISAGNQPPSRMCG
jgi:hypothetical protein